ncbi:hypothetical protein LXM63_04520 [Chryseobacterium gleum]|uniref:hypothetical protein n=1 Tax=Chryseobacterium gleum TaxID=250 RepID=UPI001E403C70|nr:hypothetical protein [Chryseobacterium gleum]MCE4064347.1 hypothetical protein [Chryseobacterium gleum]
MEAKDLRIGNFANHSELGIVEVIAVGKEYIHCIFNGETFYENIGRFSEIPLTNEWLINLGYDTDCDISENPMHFRKDGHIIWKPSSIFYDDLYRIELKYVHQLQNLFFALKGKELTLK